MTQRITNEQLRELAKGMAEDPRYAGFVGNKVIIACILDLADARSESVKDKARIADLERLSKSQEQALQKMERGQL